MPLDAARSLPMLVLSLAVVACSTANDGGFGGGGGAGTTTVASAGGDQPSTTGDPPCSVGTSGSFGTVCIDPDDVVTQTSGGGAGGEGNAGGHGGEGGTAGHGGEGGAIGQGGSDLAACPSPEDARAAIDAKDPYVMYVSDQGTYRENGLCCYSVIHDLCH